MLSITQRYPDFEFQFENGALKSRSGHEATVFYVRPKTPFGGHKLDCSRLYVLRMETREDTDRNRDQLWWIAHISHVFRTPPFVETSFTHLNEWPYVREIESITVMPCYMTDLFEYVSSVTKPNPSEALVRAIILQVLQALAKMHACGIAHRDLSGANIMLDFDPIRQSPRAYVGDFGYTKQYPLGMGGSMEPPDLSIGTMPYQSPESLLHCPAGCNPFKNDIWAVGINMKHLMTRRLAWNVDEHASEAERQLFQLNHTFRSLVPFVRADWERFADPKFLSLAAEITFTGHLVFVQEFSSEAKDLLGLLLHPNPLLRPTAQTALNHQWFNSESTNNDTAIKSFPITNKTAFEDAPQE